ncbi:ribosome maturation factor RimM [Feifania hominis]|uniref:Ribosome maturation factor RimM n=1 Tax=Feifania hominis TaxID=2763660 RepID=A0A926DDS7_9FIRM|nr:ribosome maturation factor RimM [Feifania hominis]MBC8535170.1 16S rRNA processing protein RimM [Feifania hominis]
MKQYIDTGKIVATFGVRGELKVDAWSDAPEVLLDFDNLYLHDGTCLRVKSARVHKGQVLFHFEGYDTVERAQSLLRQVVYFDRDDVELPEGSYFVQDLMGLAVVDVDTGENYGRITEVRQTGANDVYFVKNDEGREVLIPAIAQVVVETDPAGGVMKIRPLEGLFDL